VPVPLATATRILVCGPSGSGKTTLAARIAEATGLPHTEIDALHWHAGWTANPHFVEEVATLADGDAWVTEWQYRAVRPLLAARAQLLVRLDPPLPVHLRRVIGRTVRRRLLRVELWNGNLEPSLRTILTDPDHIIRWAVRTRPDHPRLVRAALAANPGLRLVTVRSERDARRLLALLRRRPAPG
jgi:adenylate kinase family enzyme